ncbi:MAG: hypothetical protein M9894_34365 [Planctomycetes bacterium]|nr:hypothetical protein [Planctomycetota bacterium]
MSDARLRDRERDAGREVGGRAAWLAERLRRGEVDPDRVRLAAYLGDAAALGVLGGPPRVEPVAGEVVEVVDDASFRWLSGVERAVGMIFLPWSGYAHLARRHFEEPACMLRSLAPRTRIDAIVLLPEGRAPGGGFGSEGVVPSIAAWLSQDVAWTGTDPLSSGGGEFFWVRDGRLARVDYPVIPSSEDRLVEFVRVSVQALGLGLE